MSSIRLKLTSSQEHFVQLLKLRNFIIIIIFIIIGKDFREVCKFADIAKLLTLT